jgi:hypothetical protein
MKILGCQFLTAFFSVILTEKLTFTIERAFFIISRLILSLNISVKEKCLKKWHVFNPNLQKIDLAQIMKSQYREF